VIPGYPNNWPVIAATSLLTFAGLFGLWRMAATGHSVAWLYVGCLILYPITYYVTTSQPRFYHALTPLLILGASFALTSWAHLLPFRLDSLSMFARSEGPKCIVSSETGVSLRRTPRSPKGQAQTW
jgi:hypothetical protein